MAEVREVLGLGFTKVVARVNSNILWRMIAYVYIQISNMDIFYEYTCYTYPCGTRADVCIHILYLIYTYIKICIPTEYVLIPFYIPSDFVCMLRFYIFYTSRTNHPLLCSARCTSLTGPAQQSMGRNEP